MLLTLKPVIYAANVADSDLATGNAMSKIVFDFAAAEGNTCVLVSAQVKLKTCTTVLMFNLTAFLFRFCVHFT